MVFLITGPDIYRARQKLAELKVKFLKEVDPSGLNMHTTLGSELDQEDIRHYLESQPFFARRRFVIFENVLSHKKPEVLRAIMDALLREQGRKEGEDNIVIFFEDEEPAAKNKLHLWLAQHAHLFRFPILEGHNLLVWVEDTFRQRGRAIAPKATRLLVASTGGDIWQLSREIQKIDSYLGKNEAVQEQTIGLMVNEMFDNNIFVLTDAIVEGDLKKSASLLTEHLARETSPQQLIALLEKQLRVMILLADAPAERAAPTLHGIHPYMAKKLLPIARRYEIERLKKIYADLMKVDIDLKSSAGDSKTLLLTFLVQSSYSKVSSGEI